MGAESPNVILYDVNGQEMSVSNGSAIPAGTSALMIAGSDGTNSRFITLDTSGRPVTVGAGTAGTPVGGVISIQGVSGGQAVPVTGTLTFTPADVTASGALGALNAAVTVTHPGLASIGFQLAAGTLVGTIVPEVSFDGGTTWNATFFDNPANGNITSSLVFGSSNTATALSIVGVGGTGQTRVRVSAFTSGTANATVRASDINDPSLLSGGAAGSILPPAIQQVGASVTTASPAYSTGTLNALSLNTNGGLRVDGSAVTQPVSGTVTANAGTGNFTVVQATAANLNATVVGSGNFNNASVSTTAAAPPNSATYVGGSVTTASPTYTTGQMDPLSLTTAGALRIDGSAVTQPVSGTVTANIGTTNGLALDTSVNGILVAQASTTSGEKGPLVQGAVTTAAPTYTTGQTDPLSLTTAGALRIDGSAVTQPVSGTVTANQGTANTLANAWSTKITDATNGPAAVKAASTAAVAADPALVVAISPNNSITVNTNDVTGTGTLNALNATAPVVLSGHSSIGMQLVAGTLVGTIVPEVSIDGGTTWVSTFFDDPVTSNKVSSIVFGSANGAVTRTIVGAGGASNARVRVSAFTSGTATCNLRTTLVTDPTELFGGAAGAALPPVVAQVGGSVTTAAPTYVTATVNALSLTTAGALRIDGSAVTQPVSGTVTANAGTGNFTVVQATAANLLAEVGGLGAAGSALVGNPVQVGGSDGANTRTLLTDASGRQIVIGAAATGAAVAGNPVYVAGKNPSGNVAPLITDAVGSGIVSLGANQFSVQSNATVTTSGSQIITTNDFGAQQINLIVNVTNAPTGTTPTIIYSLQEVDPGNGTTLYGTSSSTILISATGVYTTSIYVNTSNAVKITWTIAGTTPSFTGVYSTVTSKATPTALPLQYGISAQAGTAFAQISIAVASSENIMRLLTYTLQTTNAQRSVGSTSTNDASAGTGARQVTITYYDQNMNGPFTETVTLNGTTFVNTVGTNLCFIEKMVVISVGSGGKNAGIINLNSTTAGGGATIAEIATSQNQTQYVQHFVATGKTCYINNITMGVDGTTSVGGIQYLRYINPTSANSPNLLIGDTIRAWTNNNSVTRTYNPPLKIAGPALVAMYNVSDTSTAATYYGSFDYFDQ